MPSASKAKREAQRKEKKSAPALIIPDAAPPSAPPTIASVQLRFPACITPRQRAAIHAIGEQHGLPHTSSGDGDSRQISLGPPGTKLVQIDPGMGPKGELSDIEIIATILEHLNIDANEAFAAVAPKVPLPGASNNGKTVSRPALSSFSLTSMSAGAGAGSRGGAGTPKPLDIDQFVALMQELVEMERQAEVASAEEALSAGASEAAHTASGRVLQNLRLSDAEGGLLGRTLLTLVRNKGSTEDDSLPPHKFGPHDIVRVRAAKGEAGAPTLAQGVIYRVKENSITVAVDDVPEEGLDVPLKLEKLANEVTYDRLKAAMTALGSGAASGGSPAASLIDVLFGRRPPKFSGMDSSAWKPVNLSLDDSQRDAVSKALAAADIALIHGPPGTGKTTAVVEVIAQEVARGSRVLACAASNIAVDNLVERLAGTLLPGDKGGRRIDVVRMGHPARLLHKVLDSSLEAKVLRSDDSALAKDCRNEIRDINLRILKLGRKDRAERTSLRRDLRQLAKEERKRQERAVASVLSSAQVICATLTGVGARQLSQVPPFDVVVIDEAAQALEPACWAALLRGRKAVLAGDHLQLPPTVTSEEAARRGLLTTLFERCQATWGRQNADVDAAGVMLTTQYRMNDGIMKWSSNEMYDGKLTSHISVAGHTLGDLPAACITNKTGAENLPVLLLMDTAGCEMEEVIGEGTESKCNPREAEVTMAHVRRLLAAGIPAKDIGVITPYSAQVALLRELRPESSSTSAGQIEISTVDGFQGREKEAIVISMVRSNTAGEVGFLADNRRMNVAVTRARRHCAIVCDSDTVKSDAFLGRLVGYFEENGEYECAEEVLQGGWE